MRPPTFNTKTINFRKAVVILDIDGPDTVLLYTDLVSPVWNPPKQQSLPKLHFKFTVSANRGADYVREIFHIEPRIISVN